MSKYTKEELAEAVAASRSIRQVILHLGLNESGGNYATLKKRIKEYDLNTDHFVGKAYLKGGIPKNAKPLKDILKKGTTYRSSALRVRLIKAGLLQEQCSECSIRNQWNNKPLVLQLDHVNGDRFDNRLENLRLLCPNCHSQTETFCR